MTDVAVADQLQLQVSFSLREGSGHWRGSFRRLVDQLRRKTITLDQVDVRTVIAQLLEHAAAADLIVSGTCVERAAWLLSSDLGRRMPQLEGMLQPRWTFLTSRSSGPGRVYSAAAGDVGARSIVGGIVYGDAPDDDVVDEEELPAVRDEEELSRRIAAVRQLAESCVEEEVRTFAAPDRSAAAAGASERGSRRRQQASKAALAERLRGVSRTVPDVELFDEAETRARILELAEQGPVLFGEILEGADRREAIVSFLAVLELLKEHRVCVRQVAEDGGGLLIGTDESKLPPPVEEPVPDAVPQPRPRRWPASPRRATEDGLAVAFDELEEQLDELDRRYGWNITSPKPSSKEIRSALTRLYQDGG